jgi:hypothetical protein
VRSPSPITPLKRPIMASARARLLYPDRLVKTGAKIVHYGRSITFQMAEVMVPRGLFQRILAAITELRPRLAVRR